MKSATKCSLKPELNSLANTRIARRRAGTGLMVSLALASLGSASQARANDAPLVTRSDAAASVEVAPGQDFDMTILAARGLQPEISNYFHKAARFSPGRSIIDVLINGESIGRKTALFSQSGALCFTPSFLQSIGLSGAAKAGAPPLSAAPACPGPEAVSAQTVVALDPSKVSVDITTPAQTIAALPSERVEQGGRAAILNYRASSSASTFAGGDMSRFTELDTQAGFNWDDWIVRSNQSYSNQNGQSQSRFSNAYAQKTFVEQKQIFQAGLTYTQNPLFGGIPFIGGQWFPETALRAQNRYAVTGIASSRAHVVITQNGVILLSTVVPPGPFRLTEYQQGNRTGDFQVQVIEDSGSEQHFTIASADILLAEGNAIAGGIFASAGLMSDAGSGTGARAVPLLTFEKGWQYTPKIAVSTGALVAGKYASVGAAVQTEWEMRGRVSAYLQALAGHDLSDGSSGMLASTALGWSNSADLQLGLSAVTRTARYRSAQEAQRQVGSFDGPRAASVHTQIGSSVNWSSTWLGSVNASATHQSLFAAAPSNTYSAGWSASVGRGQLSLGLARTRQSALPKQAAGQSNNSLFLSFFMPLGRDATLNSNLRRTSDASKQRTVADTAVGQRLSDTLNYQASVQKTLSDSGESKNISVNAVPRYTALSLGAGSAPGSRSYFVQASGGVILSGQGVAFAANPIQDTFAVVKLGEVAGIKLNTPQGPVWSGYKGLTAIPALMPFASSSVEIETASLPKDVDVDQSVQVVRAGRGAVVNLDIKASKIQRVLLRVAFNGAALPESLPVLRNDSNEFFTTSLKNGYLLLGDFKSDQRYSVRLANGTTCTLRDIQVNKILSGANFQRGAATCQLRTL